MTRSIADATQAARARLNQVLTEHLLHDLAANGAEVVAQLREDRPLEYLRLVRLALPRDEESNPRPASKRKPRLGLLPRIFARFQ